MNGIIPILLVVILFVFKYAQSEMKMRDRKVKFLKAELEASQVKIVNLEQSVWRLRNEIKKRN